MEAATLRRVDPPRKPGLLRRAYCASLRTPPGLWTAINIAPKLDRKLLRATGGRLGAGLMLPSALLETHGARSGQTRTTPVLYFHDGDDVILVASSYGRERHPAWYHNLRARPDVRLGGVRFRAETIDDDSERERIWAMADRVFPGGFEEYRRRTSAVGRRIPIVRLRAAGG